VLSVADSSTSLVWVAGMAHELPSKPKVSNAQRYERFFAMTQQIGALDDVKNFEKAFQRAFNSAFKERRLFEGTSRIMSRPGVTI
jgi:hypothetical protein